MSDSEEENELGDESSDDVPMSSLRNGTAEDSPSKRKRSQVNYAENDDDDEAFEEEEEEGDDDDDDDDDDDVPLSALASPSPKKKKKATPKKAANGKKTKKATPTKKAKKKVTSSSAASVSSAKSSGSSNYKSASAALYGGDCEKGQLIQRLLCRWWYAIEWPDPAAIPKDPPKHYDPLDGFPGVYVCTDGDEVGAIKDFRDKDKCPNFNNMAKKSSAELQTLLIKALTEQRKQLIAAEGTGTDTKELDNLLKWAAKIKPANADKEAIKVLKTAKLSLD